MKSLKYVFGLLFVVVIADRGYSQFKTHHSFLHHVDATVGYYMPDLTGLSNNWSVLDDGTAFTGGMRYGVEAYTELYPEGYIGVKAGFFQEEISSSGTAFDGTEMTETMKYTAIPFGVNFIQEFHIGRPNVYPSFHANLLLLHPYIGIGTSFWRMTQDYTRVDLETESSSLGTIYQTVTAIAGFRYNVLEKIELGLEYNYEYGGFQQAFGTVADSEIVDVNANGHAFSFKISYLIHKRTAWDFVGKTRRF